MKKNNTQGFTFLELILYISLVTILLGALVYFAWGIIGSGTKSNTEQEVFSQARIVSERIKYEIRNASGVNSVSATAISLQTANAATNPTIIDYVGNIVRIKQGTGSTTALHSTDVTIPSFVFTNYTSGDSKTEHIGAVFTMNAAFGSSRQEFSETTSIRLSAEIRSN